MTSIAKIDFVKEFNRIRDMGFIESTRGKGDRAIGNTLEDALGISENNRSGHDFIDVGSFSDIEFELKSQRHNTSSLLSLFSKTLYDKRPSTLSDTDLARKYAFLEPLSNPPRYNLYSTISVKGIKNSKNPNLEKMKIIRQDNDLCLLVDNEIVQQRNMSSIVGKLKNLIYVTAKSRTNLKTEEFHYNNAIVFQDFNLENFFLCVDNSVITIDLRMHVKENLLNGEVRNHGTEFRIKPDSLEKLYDSKTII